MYNTRLGTSVRKRYIGEDTPQTAALVARARDLAASRAERTVHRSRLIRILRAEGFLSPDRTTGALLNAMANSGVFRLGGTIVGTHAFRHYEGELGIAIPFDQAAQTDDPDIAQFERLSLALDDQVTEPLSATFRDLSFAPVPTLDGSAVWRWKQAGTDSMIEFLTPSFRPEEDIRDLPALGISAQSLHYLNFLIAEPIKAAALYRSGVLIQIPRPERFAIHSSSWPTAAVAVPTRSSPQGPRAGRIPHPHPCRRPPRRPARGMAGCPVPWPRLAGPAGCQPRPPARNRPPPRRALTATPGNDTHMSPPRRTPRPAPPSLHARGAVMTTTHPLPGRNAAGVAFLIAGVAVFSVQDLILKLLSGGYPLHQAMVLRSLTAIPFLLLLVHWEGGLRSLFTPGTPAMIRRGVVMFVAYTAYYLALAALPMATTVALYFSAPLFITILSVFFLSEKVGPRRWVALMAGFAGVLIMVRPGGDLFEWAALLPVLSGLAYAISMISARRLGSTESASALAFWGNAVFLAAALAMSAVLGSGAFADESHPSLAFLLRGWVMPTSVDLMLMMACGVIAAAGLTLLTQAYRIGEASVVTPFEYTGLLWSVIYGWAFWQQWPTTPDWTGIAIIIGAGLYILWREARLQA